MPSLIDVLKLILTGASTFPLTSPELWPTLTTFFHQLVKPIIFGELPIRQSSISGPLIP